MCQGSAPLDPANHYISDSKTQAPTLARPEQFPIYLPLWKNSKADSTREPTARRRAQVRPRLQPPRGCPPRPGHGFCLPSSPHRRPRRPCSPVPGGAPGWELRAEEASRERRAHGPWAGPVTTQQLPRPRHPRPSSRMGASRPRSRPWPRGAHPLPKTPALPLPGLTPPVPSPPPSAQHPRRPGEAACFQARVESVPPGGGGGSFRPLLTM